MSSVQCRTLLGCLVTLCVLWCPFPLNKIDQSGPVRLYLGRMGTQSPHTTFTEYDFLLASTLVRAVSACNQFNSSHCISALCAVCSVCECVWVCLCRIDMKTVGKRRIVNIKKAIEERHNPMKRLHSICGFLTFYLFTFCGILVLFRLACSCMLLSVVPQAVCIWYWHIWKQSICGNGHMLSLLYNLLDCWIHFFFSIAVENVSHWMCLDFGPQCPTLFHFDFFFSINERRSKVYQINAAA